MPLTEDEIKALREVATALKGVKDACDISHADPRFVAFVMTFDPATVDSLLDEIERLRALHEPRITGTIGIPQSPLCGDRACPLHGDHPNTCVADPQCSRGYQYQPPQVLTIE